MTQIPNRNKTRKRNSRPLLLSTCYFLDSKKGFTLLFAVFAAALLLSIGLSIYTIAVKELLLSSAGRESQLAFAAADSGSECTLYWDFQHQAFTPQDPTETYTTDVACADSTYSVTTKTSYPAFYPSSNGSYRFTLPEGNCVDVRVEKYASTTPGCSSFCTTIVSEGFNTCDGTNPVRLQRTIRVTY